MENWKIESTNNCCSHSAGLGYLSKKKVCTHPMVETKKDEYTYCSEPICPKKVKPCLLYIDPERNCQTFMDHKYERETGKSAKDRQL